MPNQLPCPAPKIYAMLYITIIQRHFVKIDTNYNHSYLSLLIEQWKVLLLLFSPLKEIIHNFCFLERKCVLCCAKLLQSCLTLCDPMVCDCQTPLSMRISRQEYWNGLPCPPLGDLTDPRVEPASLTSPALIGMFFTTSIPGKLQNENRLLLSCRQTLILY